LAKCSFTFYEWRYIRVEHWWYLIYLVLKHKKSYSLLRKFDVKLLYLHVSIVLADI
jgi:hypothetical protein